MDKKFFHIDNCPKCKKYALYEGGYNLSSKLIVKCSNCGYMGLADDIDSEKERLAEFDDIELEYDVVLKMPPIKEYKITSKILKVEEIKK